MASKQSIVDFLVEQMSSAGPVAARKMFGEYAIYCGPKLVALVCDDELFIKPTRAGAALLGKVDERPPYPGAKPYLWISGERWDDGDALSALVRVTASELPVPPLKKPKAPTPKSASKAAPPRPRAKPAPRRKPAARR